MVSFNRSDYFDAQKQDLKQAVIEEVHRYAKQHGKRTPSISKVRLLTHARYFNFIINPVSFYYCFDEDVKLISILAEITNTPWGERHSYVLLTGEETGDRQYQQKGDRHHVFQFDKQFHVSPFNPMDMQYNWVLSEPLEKLHIHMDNTQQQGELIDKHFDATLMLEKHPWQSHFAKSLIQYTFINVKVAMGIYWHALKISGKKAPLHVQPAIDEKQISNKQ